ncbi:MAG: hypothetical protein A2Z14_08935 [Chloroflexi bacterium RBG_16_48_8]|nr:MAG: hypothetical protein A2Z14_08935 [Chloroflexi bacterium RBG_16_48_8]
MERNPQVQIQGCKFYLERIIPPCYSSWIRDTQPESHSPIAVNIQAPFHKKNILINIRAIENREVLMDLTNIMGLLTALIIFGIILAVAILKEGRRRKNWTREIEKDYSDLGFIEDLSLDPIQLEQLASLRLGTKPAAIMMKRIGNGTMYTYATVFGQSDTFIPASLYETVAIVSPNLRLPRFTISPAPQGLDRLSSKSMKEIDKSSEFADFNRVERVQLGIDEEYENTHLIQSTEKTELLAFLTSHHIRELKAMSHPYDIRSNESCFSIDFVPWDNRCENYLKRAAEDAETIYRILSS